MIDALLIARFEVLRAVRTWRALALIMLYAVSTGAASWLFVRMIGLLENTVAKQLGVAETHTPGAMMGELLASETYHDLLLGMVGTEELVTYMLSVPIMAVFYLWLGFLLVPFFAASASAESISLDLASRGIRFEALRTGRLEVVFGRFLGQLFLTGGASLGACFVAWGVSSYFMIGHDPVVLLGWMLAMTVRTWAFAVPFVGFGVACSQWTASAAWARVMAIGGTGVSWVLYGLARFAETSRFGVIADVALQLLPQGWVRGFWLPGMGWLGSLVACVGLGVAALGLGFVRFSRRDL